MFSKKKQDSKGQNISKINSFFTDNIKLEGNFTFVGAVRIDGELIGELSCDSTIYIGRYSKIDSKTTAKSVYCEGTFNGDLHASSNLHLAQNGRIEGKVTTPDFTIYEGAFFEGICHVLKPLKKRTPAFKRFPKRPIPILDDDYE